MNAVLPFLYKQGLRDIHAHYVTTNNPIGCLPLVLFDSWRSSSETIIITLLLQCIISKPKKVICE